MGPSTSGSKLYMWVHVFLYPCIKVPQYIQNLDFSIGSLPTPFQKMYVCIGSCFRITSTLRYPPISGSSLDESCEFEIYIGYLKYEMPTNSSGKKQGLYGSMILYRLHITVRRYIFQPNSYKSGI